MELPHLLENTVANFNGVNITPGAFAGATAALAGIAITDTTFLLARKLGAINRHFYP